jgi:hypothetical protein
VTIVMASASTRPVPSRRTWSRLTPASPVAEYHADTGPVPRLDRRPCGGKRTPRRRIVDRRAAVRPRRHVGHLGHTARPPLAPPDDTAATVPDLHRECRHARHATRPPAFRHAIWRDSTQCTVASDGVAGGSASQLHAGQVANRSRNFALANFGL